MEGRCEQVVTKSPVVIVFLRLFFIFQDYILFSLKTKREHCQDDKSAKWMLGCG